MTPGAAELARHRLARANEALTEAHTLLRAEQYNGAMNRFYYAAFHAARAMLATRGLDSSKHTGVIALFQQHFVKSGVIPANSARALPRSFEKRQNSDYSDFVQVTADDARSAGADVEAFVECCAQALDKELS